MKAARILLAALFPVMVAGCGDGSETGPNVLSPGPADEPPAATEPGILPPDPGAEGKASLEGVDSDGDGVRDDVQLAIHDRYPDNEAGRNALAQKARALQAAVIAGASADENEMHRVSRSVIAAVDCLHESLENPYAEIGFLERAIINTPERSAAYITFNSALDGHFYSDDGAGDSCR